MVLLSSNVTIFEREDKIGGLLRYGIPDFKLEKKIIDRRLEILKKEGIIFKCNIEVGKNIETKKLENDFDKFVEDKTLFKISVLFRGLIKGLLKKTRISPGICSSTFCF